MKIDFIEKINMDKSLDTEIDKIEELNMILNMYRRNNIMLTDKLFNIEHNLIPIKDECIQNLKLVITKLEEEKKDMMGNKWWGR